jgi:ABC-2 type transport system ATP-binding protein
VFIATHNLNEAQKLCKRIAVMERGRMVAVGTPRELAQEVGMRSRFEIAVRPDQVETAQQTLSQDHGVHEISVQGDVITVSGTDEELIPDLLTKLVEGGVRVYRVSPLEASVEDIYFALHDRNTTGPEKLEQAVASAEVQNA